MKNIKEIIKKSDWAVKIYSVLYLLIRKSPLFYYRSKKLYNSLNPKDYSKEKFQEIKKEILELYEKIKLDEQSDKSYNVVLNKYSHLHWRESLNFFSNLLKRLDEKYLRNQDLMYHIGVGYGFGKIQFAYSKYITSIKDKMSDFFLNDFVDSKVGFPLVSILPDNNKIMKSGSVDQILSLARVFRHAEKNNTEINSILEFGGGFGNLAYCTLEFKKDITYTIIDFPEMLSLQYLYHKLNYPSIPVYEYEIKRGIVKGALNLIPIFKIEEISNLDFDAFISTFALSETNEALIKFVSQKNFFNSKIIYLRGGINTSFGTYQAVNQYVRPVVEDVINDSLVGQGFFEILGTIKSENK